VQWNCYLDKLRGDLNHKPGNADGSVYEAKSTSPLAFGLRLGWSKVEPLV